MGRRARYNREQAHLARDIPARPHRAFPLFNRAMHYSGPQFNCSRPTTKINC